jgi:hypothetical protein
LSDFRLVVLSLMYAKRRVVELRSVQIEGLAKQQLRSVQIEGLAKQQGDNAPHDNVPLGVLR